MVGLPRNRLLERRTQKPPHTKGISVDHLLFALVSLAIRWLEPRHNALIQFLEEQTRMLRAQLDAERMVSTSAERAELLGIGAQLDHEVADIMYVVRPVTYLRWRREQRAGNLPKQSGRHPRCAADWPSLNYRLLLPCHNS